MHTPRANRLNKALRESYDLEVDLSSDIADLRDLMKLYEGKRNSVVNAMGGEALQHSPDYAKFYLISETVRMFLREIAPRRMSSRKSSQKEKK